MSKRSWPFTCCLCFKPSDGRGNNPAPFGIPAPFCPEPEPSPRCCDACNTHYVIPTRLRIMMLTHRAAHPPSEDD